MSLYYLNEAVLDLPERTFVDKTIHGLESKLPNEKTLGVFVHRRPIEVDATLRALVDENVAMNERRLSGFVVEDDRELTVDGRPTRVLRTRWRQAQRENVQLQAHVVLDKTHLIFAVGGPLEEREACEETFATLLETLTWRAE